MNATRLSYELRRGEGGYLKQRRAMIGLSLVAIGAMGFISLYQTGIIKHLPEPPLPKLNADKVDASEDAYSLFETPMPCLDLAVTQPPWGLPPWVERTGRKHAAGFRSFWRRKRGLTLFKEFASPSIRPTSKRHIAYGARSCRHERRVAAAGFARSAGRPSEKINPRLDRSDVERTRNGSKVAG
jgi:hypothetical protein